VLRHNVAKKCLGSFRSIHLRFRFECNFRSLAVRLEFDVVGQHHIDTKIQVCACQFHRDLMCLDAVLLSANYLVRLMSQLVPYFAQLINRIVHTLVDHIFCQDVLLSGMHRYMVVRRGGRTGDIRIERIVGIFR